MTDKTLFNSGCTAVGLFLQDPASGETGYVCVSFLQFFSYTFGESKISKPTPTICIGLSYKILKSKQEVED
ncbi:MAG: hypothetical protein RBR97_20305 [Bacteroidales bacterium]|nr:hypothetical protein [Bacteroidales bacterium]